MAMRTVRNLLARGVWHWCLLAGLFYLAYRRGSAKFAKRSQVELITVKPEVNHEAAIQQVDFQLSWQLLTEDITFIERSVERHYCRCRGAISTGQRKGQGP